MTEDEAKRLACENAYLKDRCAQLEASVVDLDAKIVRLRAGQGVQKGRVSSWLYNTMSSEQ